MTTDSKGGFRVNRRSTGVTFIRGISCAYFLVRGNRIVLKYMLFKMSRRKEY